MLFAGRILVLLSGIAGLLLSVGGLLFAVGLGGGDVSIVADLWVLLATLVIAAVGIWGTAAKRTWGPLAVAASSGAWAVISATFLGIPWAAVAFALSALLAIAVAFALSRTTTPDALEPPSAS